MFAIALVIFRETLEAALFVGILAAAASSVSGRIRLLLSGIIVGLVGALLLAVGLNQLSELAANDKILNIIILILALGMLGWHYIYGMPHARLAIKEAKNISLDVINQKRSALALVTVVALALLREGSETVLFISGMAVKESNILPGALLGVLTGVALGLVIYFGLTSISPKKLFQVINPLILIISASIAGQLGQALGQFVSIFNTPLWDSSHLLTTESAMGAFAHAMFGYETKPTGLQLIFFIATLVIFPILASYIKNKKEVALNEGKNKTALRRDLKEQMDRARDDAVHMVSSTYFLDKCDSEAGVNI